MPKKKEEGIKMLMSAPSTGLAVPSSFKIKDHQVNKEALGKRIAEDTKHTITGTDDTAGYKTAIAFRASYRTTRTTLAKVVKEMSQPHKDYIAGLKKASDDLGAIAFKAETYFDELITAVDDEKERIKIEAEREKQRKIQGRINSLLALGAKFDGEMYHFDYDESQFVSAFDLPTYSDVEFESVLTGIRESHNKEQERIANELLAQQQREEEQRQANLLIEQQAEQNKQHALALTEKRTKLRVKEITMMGFILDNGRYLHPDNAEVLQANITDLDDAAWDYLIGDLNWYLSNLIIPDTIPVETPATEPIEEVQHTGTIGEVQTPVTEQNWSEGIGETEHLNEHLEIEPDYSLNEFEYFVEQTFDKSKQKANILGAIAEFKRLQVK